MDTFSSPGGFVICSEKIRMKTENVWLKSQPDVPQREEKKEVEKELNQGKRPCWKPNQIKDSL